MANPEFRFVKLFRGVVRYNNPIDLENAPSIEEIDASSFPHTEHNLRVIALIKIPPKFYGEISGDIIGTDVRFDAAGMQTPNEITWGTFNQEIREITFPHPGDYIIQMTVNDKPAHSIVLKVVKH